MNLGVKLGLKFFVYPSAIPFSPPSGYPHTILQVLVPRSELKLTSLPFYSDFYF